MTSINILSELDSILDTRVACVRELGEEYLTSLSLSDYRLREQDNIWSYCGCEQDAYEKVWRTRNNDTMRKSLVTRVPMILFDVIQKIKEGIASDPTIEEVSLTINTHPYTLTETERSAFTDALTVYMGEVIPISYVAIPLELLTPDSIKGKYDILFFYNFTAWFKLQLEALTRTPLPEVTLYAPKLRESNLEHDFKSYSERARLEGRHKEGVEDLDPFDALRYISLLLVDIQFLRVVEFSELEMVNYVED